MAAEKRVLGTGTVAEADQHYTEYQYNDTSGSLTVGKPLFVDVTDAGEFNAVNSNTALSPAVNRSNGKVVLSTNANAGRFVGIFAPLSPSDKPNKGDIIRVCDRGITIVSAQSPAAGNAGNVGVDLVASTAVTDLVPAAAAGGPATALPSGFAGQLLATGSHTAIGNTIFAAASATATLCNAFVQVR